MEFAIGYLYYVITTSLFICSGARGGGREWSHGIYHVKAGILERRI